MNRKHARAARIAWAAGMTVALATTAGSALASPHTLPYTVECTTWSGTIQYHPALTKTAQPVKAAVSLTMSNCSTQFFSMTGNASVSATLTGTASQSQAALTGDITIDWPPGSGFNPSLGTLELESSPSTHYLEGMITTGAFTGGVIEGDYAPAGHSKIKGGTRQSITGTQPFVLWFPDHHSRPRTAV